MPHEKLEAAAARLRAKAKARRARRRKERSKAAGEAQARKRRIEQNNPDGVVERAKATAKQAREASAAAREFVGESAPGRAASKAATGAREVGETVRDASDDAAAMADSGADPPGFKADEPAFGVGFDDEYGFVDADTDGEMDSLLADDGARPGEEIDNSRVQERPDELDDLLL